MNKKIVYLYYVVSIAALAGFISNYNVSNTGSVMPYLETYFNLKKYHIGLIMALPGIFSLIGAFLTGMIADKIGRKKTLIIASFLLIIIPVTLAFSMSWIAYLVNRFLISLPIAMISVTASMYLAEYAPAEKRGSIVSGYQLAVVFSILAAFVINYFLTGLNENWRYMSGIAAIPAVLIFILLFTIPESPEWLAKFKNRTSDNTIKQNQKEETVSYAQLFRPPYRKMLITGSVLMALQQLTGTIQIFAFSNYIFMASGLNVKDSIYQTISIGIVNLIFTILSMLIINRFKRKTLLLTGMMISFITSCMISMFFLFHITNGIFLLIAALASIAAFAMTIGPVPWTIINEISPSRVRAKAMSFYIIAINIIGMLNCFSFPILQEMFGTGKVYLIYITCCLIGFFFIYKYLPETKGKTMEELEDIWEKKI
jgi:MFS transporter, SP family, arabinose:H+ symporter